MPKTKIKKWLKRIITVSLLSVVLSLGLTVSTTYAEPAACPTLSPGENTCTKDANTDCPSGFTGAKDGTTCNKAATSQAATDAEIAQANFLAGLQKALNRLIWPILVLIGGLMDNGLLFGNGMEQKLQDIWIPIRNLVNILFVIVLVGIALYNVLGIGDESGNYSIKSALPKIIIGIIAVNFSFLAIKVFLDAINVLTSAVFNLPGQVSEGLADIKTKDEKALCASLKNITKQELSGKSDEVWSTESLNDLARSIAPEFLPVTYDKSIAGMNYNEIEGEIRDANGADGDKQAEAYQAKFDEKAGGRMCIGSELSDTGKAFLTRWSSKNAAFAMALSMGKIVGFQEVHPDSLKNVQNLAINTLFSFFMYLIFTISFLALFVVLLARLVVMWLSIALSPVLILILAAPTLKEKMGGFNKIAENFVKLAIAPLIIALSMTIGWIMLNAIRGLGGFNKNSALSIDPGNGIPVVGLSSLQDLTVAVGTIAIIWLGVFGAAEGTIAEKATGFMKDNFQRFGTYIGTLPFKHIPFIPISLPGGGTKQYSAGEALYALERSFQKEPTRLWEDLKGEKPITPETLKDKTRVRDGEVEDFYKFLHSRGKDLTSATDVSNLRTLETERPDIWAKLGHKERDAIRKFVEDPTADNAVSDLLKAGDIKNGRDGLPAVASEKAKGGAPAAAAGATKPPATPGLGYDVKAEIGGQKLGAIFGTTATTLTTAEAAQVTQFNTHLRALAAVTKDTKADDVLKAARNVHLNPGSGKHAVAPALAELKTLLGDAKYDEVVKAAGGTDILQAALIDGAAAPAPPVAGAPAARREEPLPAGSSDPVGDADAGTTRPPAE